ncbi:MAG TPA: peptide ABC transporter substrate-binding protein, partial [Thermoleophilia bacterium]|nr:peptide ABC transporter substrate-binding protein [Thermoleophilia bacterium]
MGSQSREGRVRRRWAALLVAAIVLTAGLVWGLTSALAESASPSPGADKVTLRVGWINDPDGLNPFIGYESSAYEIWHLNYDMLIGYRAEDLAPVPELAAEMPTTSADGLTVTFKLRPNVKWQDGQPFTADDVAFTYNYIIENDMWAMSGYTKLIENVEAADDLTAVFHLSKPKANVARLWIPILPEHVWSKVDPTKAQETYVNKPPIVGTGPFQCVEEVNNKYVRMVANKGYWRGAPKIDEIVFSTYQNADAMADDLRAGNIDVAWGIPPAKFEQLKSEPTLKTASYATRTFNYLCMNTYESPHSQGNPVLRDEEFRQALHYAIDKQQLVDVAEFGYGAPATTLLTGVRYGDIDYHYDPSAEEQFTFDLEKAKQALDAAGYTDTDGDGIREYKGKPIKLRLWARQEAQFTQDAGRLITDWLKSIGLEIDFQAMDDGLINDHIYEYEADTYYAPNYDMYIWDWVGYADPSDTLVSWTTDQIENGWNDTCWSNKEYDDLFDQQMTAVDLETGAYD